jgi:hypothetical protein
MRASLSMKPWAPPPVAGDRLCFAAIIRGLIKLRDQASQARVSAIILCDEATVAAIGKLRNLRRYAALVSRFAEALGSNLLP